MDHRWLLRGVFSGVALLLLVGFSPAAAAQALRLSFAQDISLGSWSGSGGTSGLSDACVHNDSGTGYAVKASTSSGSFTLASGGNTIGFSVFFKSSSGGGGSYTELPYDSNRTFSGADQSSSSCGGSYNANLKIEISEAAISAAVPGNYSRTLTVVLTPN